jgi:hypothetical protein
MSYARTLRHVFAIAIAASVVLAFAAARAPAEPHRDAAHVVDLAAVHTGDLVFQASESAQAPAIKEAQRGHPATHTGIVVRDERGVFVLEAVGPVRLTPWAHFAARGAGVVVMRDPRLDDAKREALVAAARRDLGKPYDATFANDDARIYCSELVWRAYQAIGVDVGTVQRTGELALDGPLMRALFARRWRAHPRCVGVTSAQACRARVAGEPIMTPASLMQDDRLMHVTGTLES